MTNFINPAPGSVVTSEFGYRTHPVTGAKGSWHQGIDLARSGIVNIMAAADGTVLRAGVLGTYGYMVLLRHTINGKRMDTLYAHLRKDSIKVKVGDTVKQGQFLALMGTTGASTGQHLHFEVHEGPWATGQPNAVNPRKYVVLDGKQTVTTGSASTVGGETLVGYMESKDMDSSFANRAKLAASFSIAGYKGTAEQNTILLAKIKANQASKLFHIETGTVKTKAEIERVKQAIAKKYPKMIQHTLQNSKKNWYIKTGTFSGKAAAEAVAKDIKSIGYIANVKESK